MLQKVLSGPLPETGTHDIDRKSPHRRRSGGFGLGKDTSIRAQGLAALDQARNRYLEEMAIAFEVQSKMFPQRLPPLETLDYAASCEEARTIGGDYYDFLDLGTGRVGFVLADVSGKGISAALLMANLQASLRSQNAVAFEDLASLLRSVNQVFYKSVAPGFFATLFLAEYCDEARTLHYVNCGHNPPFLVRTNSCVEKLESTATVLGLLEEWDCKVRETKMMPGDILVAYSDGVTEARSCSDELFGEERLLDAIRANSSLSVAELLKVISERAHAFGGNIQEDDLTLLVARAREPASMPAAPLKVLAECPS